MKKPLKSKTASYLSPIVVHNGLLRGCAFVSDVESPQVAILIDNKLLTKVFCKLPIQKTYQNQIDKSEDRAKGFLVPLPAQVFDGAPHKLIARLCLPEQNPGKSTTSNPEHKWLVENKLIFQFGNCHGQVNLVDHHFSRLGCL